MLSVTSKAAAEVRRLLEARDQSQWGVRVGVKGGGCSGLSYTMQFEEAPGEHDRVFDSEGVKVFCDPKSYLYLNGLTLDYTDELIDGGFKFVNPNAHRTCSCGSSFSA